MITKVQVRARPRLDSKDKRRKRSGVLWEQNEHLGGGGGEGEEERNRKKLDFQ